MIQPLPRYFTFSDGRGVIEGVVNFGHWKEINLITSEAGMQRGNHYHKNTVELFLIIEGRIRVIAQQVESGHFIGERDDRVFLAGDAFLVEPYTNHTFEVIERSRWINVLSEPVDQRCPDIYRLRQ